MQPRNRETGGRRTSRRRKSERSNVSDRRSTASRPAILGGLGIAVSLLLALAAFDPFLFTGGDNAHYYALSEALATGRGYVDLPSPGAPPHVQYPPGFPALLVPFYIASGGSLVAMKVVPWLAGGGLLVGVWLLARRDPTIPDWAASAAVWAVGLYHATQSYSHRLLSDLPYIAVVVLSLAALQRAVSRENDPDGLDRAWIAGCVLAVFAFYVRTVGVTLLAAVGLWALLGRRWKRAGVSLSISALGVVPWWLWIQRAPSRSTSYVEQLTTNNPLGGGEDGPDWGRLLGRIQDSAVEYGTFQFPGLFWTGDTPPVGVRVTGLVLGGALVAWGMARVLRSRGIAPWDLYVAVTLAILPVWPWLGDRYMLTLAPLLWLYLLVGLDDASRRLVGGPAVGVAAMAALCGALLLAHARELPDRWDRTGEWLAGDEMAGYDPFWEDYFWAARWIGQNAPADAVVLARKPTFAWYWSGRPSIGWPFRESPEVKWRYIRGEGVTHLLIEPESARNLVEVLTEHDESLSMPFYRPGTEVAVFTLAAPVD